MTAGIDDLQSLFRPQTAEAAERALIGAALYSPDAYTVASGAGLRSRDFYLPMHEAIWESITRLSDDGKGHGPDMVFQDMARHGSIRLVQPVTILTDWYGRASDAHVLDQAMIVVDKGALRRGLVEVERARQLGLREGITAADLREAIITAVDAVDVPVTESTWSYLDDVLDMVYETATDVAVNGRPGGVKWGYVDVDKEMSPMVPGEFAVISAYSGGGKSVAAGWMALHAAVHQGKRVLFHAMEMTRLEVGQRWVSAEAHIELDHIIKGTLTPDDQRRIDAANARMVGAPLIIDEVETVTLAGLRASVRKHKPEFVVVDQIPTMTPTDAKATREQQVAAIAYGLKRLAKAEGVPVLACCQLNTNSQKRTDKTPTMHDLRESQAIVQAANTLVILSDPTEFDKVTADNIPPRAGEIDWIVRKQRQGKKDVSVRMARMFHYSKIGDVAR